MVVVIFRSEIHPGHELELERLGERMLSLAQAMPGFRSYKEFRASDGERATLVEFESQADLEAWREHADHVEAQEIGRDRLYTRYCVQVCLPIREARHPRDTDGASS